jgi:hypothetical protein
MRKCASRSANTCHKIISGGDVINDTARTVRVPVQDARALPLPAAPPRATQQGAGQGKAKPGDVLLGSNPNSAARAEKGPGGQGDGEHAAAARDSRVDDIVDWLWEEMQLPNLKARVGPSDDIGVGARGLGPARCALTTGSAPLGQGDGEAAG